MFASKKVGEHLMRQTQGLLGFDAINSFGEHRMNEPKLVQHHVKYKEIHGYDEVILIPMSEHIKLHARLRKEGKCKVPLDILNKISQKAHKRISDKIIFQENTTKNIFLIEEIKHNQFSGKISVCSYFKLRNRKRTNGDKKYDAEVRKTINFHKTVCKDIDFYEIIRYNNHTGAILYNSGFQGKHGIKLLEVQI